MSTLAFQAITERIQTDDRFSACLQETAPAVLAFLQCLEGYCLSAEELSTLVVLLNEGWSPPNPKASAQRYVKAAA